MTGAHDRKAWKYIFSRKRWKARRHAFLYGLLKRVSASRVGGEPESLLEGFQLEQRQNAPVCVVVWSCAFLFSMGMERTRSRPLRTSNVRNGTIHSMRLTRRLLIVASYHVLHCFSTNTISISCYIKQYL